MPAYASYPRCLSSLVFLGTSQMGPCSLRLVRCLRLPIASDGRSISSQGRAVCPFLFSFSVSANPCKTVWAATTKNEQYVKMQGLKHVVNFREHRQEFVASNMAEAVVSSPSQLVLSMPFLANHTSDNVSTVFKTTVIKAGDYTDDFWQAVRQYRKQSSLSLVQFLRDCVSELPQASHSPIALCSYIYILRLF